MPVWYQKILGDITHNRPSSEGKDWSKRGLEYTTPNAGKAMP